ncbi:NADPH-dependent FMN reductase [Bartonella gabonensis]|uniref:NADPH-dependent FMN reductase n=1 Tax=Bartonella gabonensis TaxID=2699889 RepID=UPI00158C57AE|nr:NAD(P)H-dependent oxidoreductase [Bartonella gabonensis]
MNIAIILGTVRTPSLTRTLARYLADCLVKRKVSPHWIDFRSIPLSDSRPR